MSKINKIDYLGTSYDIEDAQARNDLASINTKLSKLDTDTTATQGQALAWDTTSSTYKPQTVKGGHTLITETEGVDGVTNNTDAEKVVDALVVKQYANRYTERIVMTLKADTNTVGEWQDTDTSSWVIDDAHFIIIPQFYEGDNEEVEFTFLFDTTNCEPIYISGYQWVSQTTKDGKNCGALCIRCGNAPTLDTKIAVDVTRVRFDNVIVVNN